MFGVSAAVGYDAAPDLVLLVAENQVSHDQRRSQVRRRMARSPDAITRCFGLPKKKDKVGLWLIGAGGAVGSAVATGVAALKLKLAGTIGLVTELPVFEKLGLVSAASLVVGGHEVRSDSFLDGVKALRRQANLFDDELIRRCTPTLRSMQRNVRFGTLGGSSTPGCSAGVAEPVPDRSPAETVQRLSSDIEDFRDRHRLDHVVVVNVASTEPMVPRAAAHASFTRLSKALNRPGSRVLPTSSLYALAAIESGAAFINFTPSPGLSVPALRQRADELDAAYMGSDGKTGESLVKSVLAPMFATRNLKVLSWVGQNILGNRDGAVLANPIVRKAKLRSKDAIVKGIVDHNPKTHVSIDYVPSLDDWKVAWDFVHFEGFLGTKMSLQFTWQGSDSLLAAPLIIDLARLTAHDLKCGRHGPLTHLACFFKDPTDVTKYDHYVQWRQLMDHLERADAR